MFDGILSGLVSSWTTKESRGDLLMVSLLGYLTSRELEFLAGTHNLDCSPSLEVPICQAELGRNPVSKHQIQSEYGDGQADAGWDCRTRLARPNSQARTGTGKCSFSLFS